MYSSSVFILLILVSLSSTAIVTWIPNLSFNLPINFKDGKLPCSKQTVVFEDTINTGVKIESEISIAEMILPMDGELIIDGTITVGADEKDNCTDSGNVYYKQKSTAAWLQPDVWSSDRFNEATPDAERVPCYDDDVVFPKDSTFTIFLPNRTQNVRTISRGNLHSRTQTFIYNVYYNRGYIVSLTSCPSRAGCPCQDILNVDCTVKFCPVPKCVDAIQPIGHCCHICGGFLTFNVGESFELMAFQENVAKSISWYKNDRLVYHIGRLPGDLVQLVIVEKGEYDGISAEVANDLRRTLKSQHGALKATVETSGSPLSQVGMAWRIVISVFFGVIIVMGAIYAYYYKLPEFRYPMIRSVGGRGVVSRFNRRTESVVSLTRRDSGTATGSPVATAFRNPMYDSKRGRVQVDETVVEDTEE